MDALQPAEAQPRWRIESQSPAKVMGPGNVYVDGHTLNVLLRDGTRTVVNVPDTEYAPQTVRGIVERHVANVEQINALQG